MKKQDYESLTRLNKFKRILKVALITILVAVAVLAPALWYWDLNIEMRATLRSAKNVLLNTELIALRYDGLGEKFLDSTRPSGLSEPAEDQIKEYAAVDGQIQVTAWDEGKGEVLTMTYEEKRFLITYEKEAGADEGRWTIYRRVRVYDGA